MACGLPVVAADASGVTDLLHGGEAAGGLIVPLRPQLRWPPRSCGSSRSRGWPASSAPGRDDARRRISPGRRGKAPLRIHLPRQSSRRCRLSDPRAAAAVPNLAYRNRTPPLPRVDRPPCGRVTTLDCPRLAGREEAEGGRARSYLPIRLAFAIA